MASIVPLGWLRGYRAAWLGADAVAGLTLAAYAIPVSLAYATLAGLPPETGVFCYLVAGPAYALFGTSRQLALGPTSAISLLVGTTVAGMALGDPVRYAQIAALTALVVAGICFAAWALRASSLVDFISETILLGFKAGAAFTIAMTQLPKLFGVPGGGDHFFERAATLVTQLPQTNGPVLLFGLAAIACLAVGDRLLPGRPVALAVVAASIVALSVTPLATLGFKTVGVLPAGLPALSAPSLQLRDVDGVIPLAFACFLLAYIESVSAARTLAARHGDAVDPRQELLGLGAANAAAAFCQAYPLAGGLSQSTVNDKAGARSPLALVFASCAMGVCLLFFTGLLRNLPDVVLAAVVLVAVKGLVNVRELRRVHALSRTEFWVAMVAFAGVLLLGILKGVLLAAIVSMLLLIRRVAAPPVVRLARVAASGHFAQRAGDPSAFEVPGVCVVRAGASLLYFNALHVRDAVLHLARERPVTVVVWDLSTCPHIDIAGARMLAEVAGELARERIVLHLAGAHSAVLVLLREEAGATAEAAAPVEDVVALHAPSLTASGSATPS